MNTSLCITTLNEEISIGPLLDSVFSGTKKPDEIVIVDGGSKDKTISTIHQYQKKYSNIRLIIQKGGIACGRNLSVAKAKGNIIVQTDAGCVVTKNWFNKITRPFSDNATDIVAGYYKMQAARPLQSALNVFYGIPPQRFNPNTFIPSARSVAFRKQVWKKMGGYNENLKAGEDTLFFEDAVKNNFKMERVGDAIVIWEETRNLKLYSALKKFFNYAKGDAISGVWWNPDKRFMSHNIKVILIFLRYFFALIFLSACFYYSNLLVYWFTGLLIYLLYPVYKWHDVISNLTARLWLPIIQITSDLAVMSGFASGIIERKWLTLKRH